MRIALVSFDPVLGGFDDNVSRALILTRQARDAGAQLAVFPAYALCGAPAEGLAYSEAFIKGARAALNSFARDCPIPTLISTIAGEEDAAEALTIARMAAAQRGMGAPSASPELFASYPEAYLVQNGTADSLALASWDKDALGRAVVGGAEIAVALNHPVMPSTHLEGVNLLVGMCADDYEGVVLEGQELDDALWTCYARAAEASGVPAAYVNLLGGQDACVFDGRCAAFAPGGGLAAHGELFTEGFICFDLDAMHGADGLQETLRAPDDASQAALDWAAVVLATGDYLGKNGFTDCVVGLSGGLDSSVVATIAVDAMGAEHVHGVLMPGPFSSQGSLDDALELARRLRIGTYTVPITPALDAFEGMLSDVLPGGLTGLAHENTQARIRMVELMAFSNARGWMLLNTGNKSEAAMGFSTLYGDTAGAFAPVGDIYKTRLYALARWRNVAAHSAGETEPIPQNVLIKPPSAELYPGQRDDERLPPYTSLDPVLFCHIEGGLDGAEIVGRGFGEALVGRVLKTVRLSEFKRRAEPVAPAISGMPLTAGRAWPMTNGWHDLGC